MLNWNFIIEHIFFFKDAIILTFKISFFGIVLALIIGFVCALLISFKKIFFLSKIIEFYVEFARNTPLLIQLFFLYFALPKIGIKISPESCAIIGLAFLGGGYMCESFRLGLQSVGKAQIESALSIGLNPIGLIVYVVIPQALSVALPSIGANVIFLVKETSVVGILALADVLYVSKDIINVYGKTYEALFMLLLAYLVILLPLSILFSVLEKNMRKKL